MAPNSEIGKAQGYHKSQCSPYRPVAMEMQGFPATGCANPNPAT